MYVYIYIYIYIQFYDMMLWYIIYNVKHQDSKVDVNHRPETGPDWILGRGGCSGRGVQWMGVVQYSKTAYNIM